MEGNKKAFQIDVRDNVATALEQAKKGEMLHLVGECREEQILAETDIPVGHKIALKEIETGEEIIKYGVVIGCATEPVKKGSWVHLHVMKSLYDRRSGHLDTETGAPMDTKYE